MLELAIMNENQVKLHGVLVVLVVVVVLNFM